MHRELRSSDVVAVREQLGREPTTPFTVVARCSEEGVPGVGHPLVIRNAPLDAQGDPFPTTFWLTCPQLVSAVSRLEAAGGVERWTRAAAEDPRLAASLERAHAEQRRLRPELDLGVGGARAGAGTLKCLHAHVAFALARPGYELGEQILAEVDPAWPSVCCAP